MHFLIGGKLLYYAVLISAIQQCKSAIIIHISLLLSLPPLPLSHTFSSSQSAKLDSLCYIYIYNNFSPAICLQ